MTTDLVLAIAHHLLMFTLAALLATEIVWAFRGIAGRGAVTIARLDALFGVSAAAILVVGFLRVFLGANDESFYLENPFFWAKIGALAVVALLSILPTINFIRWSRLAGRDPAFTPDTGELARVRRLLVAEGLIFLLIPAFAAVMARGIGLD